MVNSTRTQGAAGALLLCLAGLLAGCGGSATATSGTHGTETTGGGEGQTSASAARPFLWEVRSGDHVSYLFGTCHAGVRLDDSLTPPYRAALDGAAGVVLEADVAAMDPQVALAASMLPPDRSLDHILDADTYQHIVALLAANVPEAALRRMRPWLVSTLVLVLAIEAARPDAGTTPMDADVAAGARTRHATVSFLEEPSEQIAMINGVPEAFFVDSLADLVRDPERARAQTLGLLEAYAAGDEAATSAIVFEQAALARWPAVFDAMFFQRNQRWSTSLAPRLREGGLFVAVGVGHLLGDQSLVAKLRAAGFTVTRAGDPGFTPGVTPSR